MKVFIVESKSIMFPIRHEQRQCIARLLKEKYPNEEIEFIDSRRIEDEGRKSNTNPLLLKCQTLQLLSTADIVVFNTENESEYRFERLACDEYNITSFTYIDIFDEQLIKRNGAK